MPDTCCRIPRFVQRDELLTLDRKEMRLHMNTLRGNRVLKNNVPSTKDTVYEAGKEFLVRREKVHMEKIGE